MVHSSDDVLRRYQWPARLELHLRVDRAQVTRHAAAQKFGQRALAKAAGVSFGEVSAIVRDRWKPTLETLAQLVRAIPQLEAAYRQQVEHEEALLGAARERCQQVGLRQFAEAAEVDWANLAHVLAGKRKLSAKLLSKLESVLPMASADRG